MSLSDLMQKKEDEVKALHKEVERIGRAQEQETSLLQRSQQKPGLMFDGPAEVRNDDGAAFRRRVGDILRSLDHRLWRLLAWSSIVRKRDRERWKVREDRIDALQSEFDDAKRRHAAAIEQLEALRETARASAAMQELAAVERAIGKQIESNVREAAEVSGTPTNARDVWNADDFLEEHPER